ncbi:pirin [Paenibacillus psychroresistens]|uniref:Pirin n=1 Tax=Paenibacillus psychroresistens TaxID=1778678 RepID=A0A6B8RNG8_9BACL|nr:pirin family protein [Paenibacillus psychroresistens]QGQ97252.1 pirin [Paenibacillus psychroresistens]
MNIQIMNPKDQGKGEFDEGKIIVQKPIGFSGEGSTINRLGPLFYWSWALADSKSGLGFHPHQGFEIMSYGLAGQGTHRDTLGTESTMTAGDIQLMQAGSGISHAESVEAGYEGFQIWLEPNLNDAVKRVPTYALFKHEEFPISTANGVQIKTILGEGSPVEMVTEAQMIDIEIEKGASFVHRILPNWTIAALAIRGGGTFKTIGQQAQSFEHKDFIVFQSDEEDEVKLEASGEKLRIIFIEIPTKVDYPLYHKRK